MVQVEQYHDVSRDKISGLLKMPCVKFACMCNEPAKRKRLGRSGTFMAQWFRR